jgi:F5/8 type C domain
MRNGPTDRKTSEHYSSFRCLVSNSCTSVRRNKGRQAASKMRSSRKGKKRPACEGRRGFLGGRQPIEFNLSLLQPAQSSIRLAILLIWAPILVAATPVAPSGGLRVLPQRILAIFRPVEVFGVAVDGGTAAETGALFYPENGPAIRAAHFKSVSYRLRTELAGQVWHWSSYGRWSDQEHHQGYWTGDSARDDNHELSFGYRLPRRGNSRDEANDDGFSRIDDGDVATFWKSNPYLDPKLDGIGVERQWVIVDLGRERRIDTAQIHWAEPYASEFRLQRWVGSDQYDGNWRDLTPALSGHPGTQSFAFGPATTRFVRILLEQSSHVSKSVEQDPRDAMGYAISEVGLGITPKGSVFRDYVRHDGSGHRQTQIFVSSTDPWHREVDRDPDSVQPSPVVLHARALFAGPFMIALGLVTDTPENALAEFNYFRRRGLPIDRVELGEEPEGQLAPPRMVAALYDRLALQIAREDPHILIGGPSLIDPSADTTLDDQDDSWTKAFLQSLRASRPPSPIAFISTELYPVENLCAPPVAMLDEAASSPKKMTERFSEDGASEFSAVITEYGLSPYGGKALLGVTSALADAEILGNSLSQGVLRMYIYGTSPTLAVRGERRCAGWGNLNLWKSDRRGHIRSGSILLRVFKALRDRWSNPNDAQEELLAVAGAPAGIDAFALRREDGSVSIMLVNRTAKVVSVKLAAPSSMVGLRSSRTIIADRMGFPRRPAYDWLRKTRGPLPADIEIEPESLIILNPSPD